MVIKDVAGRAACSNKHGLAHAIWGPPEGLEAGYGASDWWSPARFVLKRGSLHTRC